MLDQFVPRLASILSRSGSAIRLISAGRFISHWKQLNPKLPLHLISLPLFDFQTVGQLVENFVLKSGRLISDAQYKNDFAAHLMYFTGGHPGCMMEILKQDFIFLPIEDIAANEDKYFETIVRPVVDDIREHIPDDLQKIFDTLSVLRRFSAGLLRVLLEKGLIKWSGDEYALEKRLFQTYLMNKESGLVKNGMARQLLAAHLRKTNLDHYVRVCEGSVSFYKSLLKESNVHRPDMIAAELLFQSLQHVFYKQHGNKEQFFESLGEILDMLVTGRDALPVMESLAELLKNDGEFRFTFNYLFRGAFYDGQPFNMLICKIFDAVPVIVEY